MHPWTPEIFCFSIFFPVSGSRGVQDLGETSADNQYIAWQELDGLITRYRLNL
jgi:hypothetical protein